MEPEPIDSDIIENQCERYGEYHTAKERQVTILLQLLRELRTLTEAVKALDPDHHE